MQSWQTPRATGGLRGGNVQAALGQFQPQLLAQLIDQQYSRLGGLTSIGQNAAAGVGNAGMSTGNSITGCSANRARRSPAPPWQRSRGLRSGHLASRTDPLRLGAFKGWAGRWARQPGPAGR
jgi:hypothetical protein